MKWYGVLPVQSSEADTNADLSKLKSVAYTGPLCPARQDMKIRVKWKGMKRIELNATNDNQDMIELGV